MLPWNPSEDFPQWRTVTYAFVSSWTRKVCDEEPFGESSRCRFEKNVFCAHVSMRVKENEKRVTDTTTRKMMDSGTTVN